MSTYNPTEYVDVQTAAAELGLTVRAVQHRIKVGTLDARKLGAGRTSPYMIPRAELDRLKAATPPPV